MRRLIWTALGICFTVYLVVMDRAGWLIAVSLVCDVLGVAMLARRATWGRL